MILRGFNILAEAKDRVRPELKQLFSHPANFFSFGFGSGLAPIAPGTFGTLAAIPFYLLLQYLPVTVYASVLVAAFLVGVYLCGATAKQLNCHDHPAIVWDEFVGYWLTMLCAPKHWLWVVLGFVFFRLFDIVKPWPIRWFDQHVHGGLGIMLDDVVAAVFALLALQSSYWVYLNFLISM